MQQKSQLADIFTCVVKKGNGNSVNSIVLSHYWSGFVRGNKLVSDLSIIPESRKCGSKGPSSTYWHNFQSLHSLLPYTMTVQVFPSYSSFVKTNII